MHPKQCDNKWEFVADVSTRRMRQARGVQGGAYGRLMPYHLHRPTLPPKTQARNVWSLGSAIESYQYLVGGTILRVVPSNVLPRVVVVVVTLVLVLV